MPRGEEEAPVEAALARVAGELLATIELPALLERLCRVATEVLEGDVSYTFQYRDEFDSFLPVAVCGESPEVWNTVRALRISKQQVAALTAQVDRDGVLHLDADAIERAVGPEIMTAYNIRTVLVVPLRHGDAVVATQMVGRRQAAAFTPQQERIARGLARLASMALDNARLYSHLEQANRLKTDFLATVSHELRTPLNVIIGYNELLLDEVFGGLTPEQAASLDRVGTSACELLELINATLDISRMETGSAAVSPQDLDLGGLVLEIEAETRAMREKPGVSSRFVVSPELPRIYSDAVKLKVLLKNLIANAMKFTESGSVTVNVAAHDGWIQFDVVDTGVGMSPETQAVIFEPFRQGESAAPRRQGGVGLGLYIVARLLDLLAGRIEVDSAPGRGSTFRVWVPVDMTRFVRLARA